MRVRLTIVAAVATLLSSICLYPFFDSGGWFWVGLGTVVSVAVAGLAVRQFRLPAWVNLLAGLVAILLFLNAAFAAGRSLLWIIPTPASLSHLGHLMASGKHDINAYSAPVPLLPGISLLTGLGIGLIALLVDFLAVRLRRAAPAGLPLLAMYSIPAEVRQHSVHWVAFLLGAAGYLGLLITDSREQLSSWGRPVFTRRWSGNEAIKERPDSSLLAVSGRRIGLTAVVVAVMMPVAVPGLAPRTLLDGGGSGKSGHGQTTVGAVDPLVSLKGELLQPSHATVLTYRSSEASPDYLRMYALDQFNGADWGAIPQGDDRNAPLKGNSFPAPQGAAAPAKPTVTTKVRVDDGIDGMKTLPVPYPPGEVSIKGSWRVDARTLVVYSSHDSAGGRNYTVNSRPVAPTTAQLEAAGPPPVDVSDIDLKLPPGISPDIYNLARQVTAGAQTPYDKALRLQDYFTRPGRFTYSLTVAPTSNVNALHDFLFVARAGYCQQFAAAMAVLARLAGIPARVAVGYTAGSQLTNGERIVRTDDAHAWPELYFGGVGWLRFEPTPNGPVAGQGSATVPAYAYPTAASPGSTTGPLPPTSTVQPGAPNAVPPNFAILHRSDPGQTNLGTDAPTARAAGGGVGRGILVVLAIVLVLLILPVAAHVLTRRRRWARAGASAATSGAVAHAAWEDVMSAVHDLGLPRRASDSPRAAARRLIEHTMMDDTDAEALTRLAAAEELARYARSPGTPDGLREDSRMVRAALFASSDTGTRWRARLAPRSTIAMFKDGAARVLEVFDRLDAGASRIRRLIPSRSR